MPTPPAEVPENRTADEYNVLALLYGAMGKPRLALQASQRAAALAPPPEFTEALAGLPAEEAQEAAAAGMEIASQMMNLLLGPSEPSAEPEKQADELLVLMQQLRDLAVKTGAKEEELFKFDEGVNGLMDALSKTPETPPRTVPENLSAQEYYELGVRYKTSGWTEQSRDALQYAMELDPDGETGKLALSFMRSKLPRHPVPLSAEQANIQGFNLMVSGDLDGAIAIFEQIIKEHADFEWPQGNLGSIYIEQGKLAEAERILVNAVQLNPFYLNAWSHLCRANLLQSKYTQARYCVEQIRKIDPTDAHADQLQHQIDTIEQWEKSGGSFA